MFSQITIPMSTIVPIAMAIPERATMLASTPKNFIAMKHIRTAIGSNPLIKMLLRRCITMRITTMIVIRISSLKAL